MLSPVDGHPSRTDILLAKRRQPAVKVVWLTLTRQPRRPDSVSTRDCPLNRARYAATANLMIGGVVVMIVPAMAGPDVECLFTQCGIETEAGSVPDAAL